MGARWETGRVREESVVRVCDVGGVMVGCAGSVAGVCVGGGITVPHHRFCPCGCVNNSTPTGAIALRIRAIIRAKIANWANNQGNGPRLPWWCVKRERGQTIP